MYMYYTKSIYYTISTNDIMHLYQNVCMCWGGGGVNFINQLGSLLLFSQREQLISSLVKVNF